MRLAWIGVALACAGCSSVEVPREHVYRLALPATAAADPERAGVLRVHDLQLATSLDGDCLQQQCGLEVRVQPHARWVAPLDRLVTDALVLGLSRASVCDLVKSGLDPGDETWALRGRIVEFTEGQDARGRVGRVALELWLEQAGAVLFQGEFAAVVPVEGTGTEPVVRALSRGVQQVCDAVVGQMRERQLFAVARGNQRAALAQPPR